MAQHNTRTSSSVTDEALIKFFFVLGNLKTTVRTGWTNYPEIKDPESVADHVWRCAMMALVLAPRVGVDASKTCIMLVIHELGEAVIGDIITDIGASDLPNAAEKEELERKAVAELLEDLGMEAYLEAYDEFVAHETPEARLAYQIDRIEMGVQAREYELAYRTHLDPFFLSVERRVTDPKLIELLPLIKEFQPTSEDH